MKLLFVILLSSFCLCQDFLKTDLRLDKFDDCDWHPKWDTTVVSAGDSSCTHSWVEKQQPIPTISCEVFHDCRGCPSGWRKVDRICEKCLRKEHIQEDRIRTVSKASIEDQKYQELDKLIKK